MLRARLKTATLAALAALRATSAHAQEASLAWWVEVEPADCAEGALVFARAVDLACDAVGRSCTLARSSAGAERRAVLACGSDGPWRLHVRDARGASLFTLEIDGDKDDRVRRAAFWIARTQRGPLPPPEAPLAPARVAPPRSAPAVAPPPSEPIVAPLPPPPEEPALQPAPAERDVPSAPSRRRDGGLALAFHGATAGGLGPLGFGARAAGALGVSGDTSVGLALDVSRASGGVPGYALTVGRAGALLAWGAPWDASTWGFALEGGALAGDIRARAGASPSSRGFLRAYAQASAIAQLSGGAPLRPWAALSIAALGPAVRVIDGDRAVALLPSIGATLDLGVAWTLW